MELRTRSASSSLVELESTQSEWNPTRLTTRKGPAQLACALTAFTPYSLNCSTKWRPMHCPTCGHLNEAGANFCSRCGASLGVAEADVTSHMPSVEAEEDDELDVSDLKPGEGCLIVRRGSLAGTRFTLASDRASIGRHPEADVFLNDITVSRRHAEIHREGNEYLVSDLGSLNGTYLNRKRAESSPLHNGDEVQVGKFRLLFLQKEEEA